MRLLFTCCHNVCIFFVYQATFCIRGLLKMERQGEQYDSNKYTVRGLILSSSMVS